MSNSKTDIHPVIYLLGIVLGVYLIYWFTVLLIRVIVFLGYNWLFFLDNLLMIGNFNPVVIWGLFGLFIGSIFGVIIAVKKYKLSKTLILYPIVLVAILISIMCFVNKPTSVAGTYISPENQVSNTTPTNPATRKYYYITIANVKVRTGPSIKKAILFSLKKGAEVQVLNVGYFDSNKIEWAKIKSNDREGYLRFSAMQFSRYEE
jgi:hypothetical protein